MRQKLTLLISIVVLCLSIFGVSFAQQPPPPPTPSGGGGGGNGGGGNDTPAEFDTSYQAVESTYNGIGTITMGEGEEVNNFSLTTECPTGDRFVTGATGLVVADDGSEWYVPMQTTEDGAGSVDLFNSCSGSGATSRNASAVSSASR